MNRGTEDKKYFNEIEDLFRFYYPRLKAYANKFLNDSQEANDVIQDVFYQIWKEKTPLDKSKNISSYIFLLVKNRCLNLIKRNTIKEKYLLSQGETNSEELYEISFNSDNEFVSMHELLQTELKKLIDLMPEKCGMVFTLKWIEGKKNREIAEEMNISTTMVDKHIAKGIAIAKKNLDPDLFILFQIYSIKK